MKHLLSRSALSVALVSATLCVIGWPHAAEPPAEEPRELGIKEKVSTRLAQLDVTITGPQEVIEKLGPEDFDVWVNRRNIPSFSLDRICREGETQERLTPPEDRGVPVPVARVSMPATYLFYFDQPHLTLGGRQRALDLSRELIPKLAVDGARVLILSNSAELSTVVDLTSDSKLLLQAIDRLEKDRKQWDAYSELEGNRLEEVIGALNDPTAGYVRAITLAREYAREERWRAEKDLRRFAMVLGRVANLDPPKIVLYFADTLRTNAGEHYLSLFGSAAREEGLGYEIATDAFSGALPFDRVVQEASAHGVRFYTVQAEGLVNPTVNAAVSASGVAAGGSARSSVPFVRIRDAQDTLVSLAAETGGRAFLNGVTAAKIADRILKDISCLYLVSFDPKGFSEDIPLPVRVNVLKPKVKAQVRGMIVLQSETARLTSQLLSAFAAPEAAKSEIPLHAGIIPTGFRDGAYTGLVQIAVRGLDLPGTSWDLGASIVSRGKVRANTSGRITGTSPRFPVVLETEMSFAPGPYEIVAVAHETSTHQIASRQVEGSWPSTEEALALVGPIAVLQPVKGGFVRDGKASGSGTLERSDDEPVRVDLPTAIIGLICRAKDQKGPLHVERRLIGETEATFPPMDLELGQDRCAQVRDIAPAGSMGAGGFRYEIQVTAKGVEVAKGLREFSAVLP